MIVSYEINILCESDNCNGHGASGIFTSSPIETADLAAAVKEAEHEGWRIERNVESPQGYTKAFCPDCVAREMESA